MNEIKGNLRKMQTKLASPVEYQLTIANEVISVNSLLEKPVQIMFTGNIHCIQCGRGTKKSFQQGYCYPCFLRLQECNCQVRPENCKVFSGTCDPNDWAHVQCSAKHYVYLANSSGIKVGITRQENIPSRWLDQGATQGLIIMHTVNRKLVGQVEVILKQYIQDRTNWQAMLKQSPPAVDLVKAKQDLLSQAEAELVGLIKQYDENAIGYAESSQVTQCVYPVLQYPQKVKALNFDKNPTVNGVLQGIKGQYLIFDTGVLNVRKFAGYEVIINQ